MTLWLDRARIALIFLTRLPVAAPRDGGPTLADSAGLFPLAGVVVGALGGLIYWLGDAVGLPPVLAAFGAVGATILATGALHEDGLADVADGFGGGFDRERKLEIMRDSALGSYGALALILSLGARVAALAALADPAAVMGALVAAHGIARATLPAVMGFGRPARSDGLGAGAGRPDGSQVSIALGLGLLLAALAVGPFYGLACLAIAGLGTVILVAVAARQIGGYTGDVLGAIEQLGEVLTLLLLVSLL